MDQNLRQRLVGAIVLISLAVIFLPLAFDGQQERIDTGAYNIPEKPIITIRSTDVSPIQSEAKTVLAAVQEVEQEKAAQEQIEQAPKDSESTQELINESAQAPQTNIEENAVTTKAGASADPVETYVEQEQQADEQIKRNPDADLSLADAWIIQVGAFSSNANAEALRDKLIRDDFKAYIKVVQGLHKVYVGPEIRKYRLEQQKQQLEQQFGIKALILKYIP